MSSDKDDDDKILEILMYSDKYTETMDQNEKNTTIKKLNYYFDKMIYKSKSFEYQIESLKKVKNLHVYFINDFDDKELKSKIFKLKLANLLKIIDKTLFKQMFGDTLETLANKLVNTTNKKKSNNY